MYDLVVIGAGPGGYVAAIKAAQLGLKVAIIEKQQLGGVCLNWGCIPTKALLRSAEVYHNTKNLQNFGLAAKEVTFDIKKIVERSRNIANQLSQGVKHLLKKHKINIIEGHAKLLDSQKILVEHQDKSTTIITKNIIIATGARAKVLAGYEPDGKLVITAKEAMVPEIIPKKILIVGSGAIGVEFASFYNSFGSEVTVLEARSQILPSEDIEISEFAHREFIKHGINIITNIKLQKLQKNADHVVLTIEHNGKIVKLIADKLIMAVGIVPNTENLGLENTKIKFTASGSIMTDQFMSTAEPGVYAVGDVVNGPWLAHKASHEGIICVEKIAGWPTHPLKIENIPACTYSHPQIASVGISEATAIERGYQIKVGRFPYIGNGKAAALGETAGLVKTIFDERTGELLGAHMVGAEVTELIQGFVVGKTMEAVEEDFMRTVFAHPTLSEMMHESVLAAYGKAIHI